jgi:GRASP55/65 PDZ-like domain
VVELYVYNTDSDLVRVVALYPTRTWGGAGLLGAEVGTGYLHRLPAAARTTEGASVERKVRYVPAPPTSGGSRRSKTSIVQQLELEPQLEMELADPSEDDGDHMDGKQQFKVEPAAGMEASRQVRRSTRASSSTLKDPPPATDNVAMPVASTLKNPPPDAASVAEQSSANPTQAASAFPPPPPQRLSVAPPMSTKASPEALGDRSLLPPPPKMHYYSSPKISQ